MPEWSLREEIINAFHNWPMIVASILGGALLGFLVAFLIPAPYRASTEIAVLINPYRTVEDRYNAAYTNFEFRNPDDYKHWQMSQLNALVYSDEYIEETLNRLREQDPAWNDISRADLSNMLAVAWRNAGRWMLSAETDNQQMAAEALDAWKSVILEKVNTSIDKSKELYQIDLDLRAIEAAQLKNQEQELSLKSSLETIKGMSEELVQNHSDRPLDPAVRSRLLQSVAQSAELNEGWRTVFESFPVEGAPTSEYQNWIDLAMAALEQAIQTNTQQSALLDRDRLEKTAEWQAGLEAGKGLAATMQVEELAKKVPKIQKIRTTSLAVLVGAFLGLVVWVFATLIIITRKTDIHRKPQV